MTFPSPAHLRAALLERLVIELPMPPQILLKNRVGWGRWDQIAKSKAVKAQRQTARFLALAALAELRIAEPPMWKDVRISPAFWPASHQGLGADPMNRIGSLAGAVDGLEDAGIVENDRGVQFGKVTHPGIDSITPHVVLTIEHIEGATT